MGAKIAMGFHTCIDFELKWKKTALEEMIHKLNIYAEDIAEDLPITSVRNLLVVCLNCMKKGIGKELFPINSKLCMDFAKGFEYEITIGGTAARAAIALQKIGHKSALQSCCYNHYIKEKMPDEIEYMASVGEKHTKVYPHIILQYPAGERIKVNDIDFTTPRENRIMFSKDLDSERLKIEQSFELMIQDAEVFLLSSFNMVQNFSALKNCLVQTRQLLNKLPNKTLIIMEDSCYQKKEYRQYVHHVLHDFIDILSMNEDELQDYIGRRIDILKPEEVLQAVTEVYRATKVKTLVIHTAHWALAWGENAEIYKMALESGIAMASARFQKGDFFTKMEYDEAKHLKEKDEFYQFSYKIEKSAVGLVSCVASKDLSFVDRPTTVGLGDYFIGGLLAGLVDSNI